MNDLKLFEDKNDWRSVLMAKSDIFDLYPDEISYDATELVRMFTHDEGLGSPRMGLSSTFSDLDELDAQAYHALTLAVEEWANRERLRGLDEDGISDAADDFLDFVRLEIS